MFLLGSEGPEGVGWGEPGGAKRWVKPGQRADRERGAEPGPDGRGGDGCGLCGCGCVSRRGGEAEQDAGGGAKPGEQERLGEELGADLASGCTERAAGRSRRAAPAPR